MRWAMLCLVCAGLSTGCAAPVDGGTRSQRDDAELKLGENDVRIGTDPLGFPARYPIVLMHGFNAAPDSFWSYNQVEEALRADGHTVYELETYPFRPVADRAQVIVARLDEIFAETGADKVHLVAHSMGGLDARYVVSTLGYGDRVASVTTLATPHRGTPVADFAMGPSSWAPDAINALAEAWGKTYSDVASDPDIVGALIDLSEAHAPEFDGQNPDDDRVMYFSWGGVATVAGTSYTSAHEEACNGLLARREGDSSDRVHVMLYASHAVVAAQDGEVASDGLVPTKSMHWGHFRGCLPTDHFEIVGQGGPDGGNGRTGFDHFRFYRTMAYELAALEDCAPADVQCELGDAWADWPTRCTCAPSDGSSDDEYYDDESYEGL
jgi:triacylglycerol lipase